MITGTGALRKIRHGDATRGKGKRGGLRIIYDCREPERQFWRFTLYDKNVILLCNGGEKKTQEAGINTAIQRWKEWNKRDKT